MRSYIFGNAILGSNSIGQGSNHAVGQTHLTTLRTLVALLVRGLTLRLGAWRALILKRAVATTTAVRWCPAPAVAVCASCSPRRRQRLDQVAAATMPGVVVAPGTVGVC